MTRLLFACAVLVAAAVAPGADGMAGGQGDEPVSADSGLWDDTPEGEAGDFWDGAGLLAPIIIIIGVAWLGLRGVIRRHRDHDDQKTEP